MQTSRHRYPGSCTTTQRRRPLSSSSLSSTTYASTRRRSPWALAWSREPRPSREKRWRGHWPGRGGGMPVEEKRVVDHGGSGARGDGVLARSRAGPSRRAKNEPTPPIYAIAATRAFGHRFGSAEGFVPVAPGLYPAKAATATAPVIGLIIEFLPTGPHQTARGDAPDATETQGLAQLRPVHGLHAHRL